MYAEWSPGAALADRVACLWEQDCAEEGTQLVVPDACVDLIWGPGGPHVAGPDTGPVPVRMRAGDVYRGIRFRPGALGGLLGVPADELRDERVPFADLGLPEDLTLASLTERLRRSPAPDPAAPAIAAALRGGASVREVAWDLGLSERHLHRRAVAAFGYSPKTLQRIVRFQRALRLARSGVPLATVAVESGYTDQAHLSHEVKRLSGVSMSGLLVPA
ncbi:helix-turn-helix transcriptional regulator [Nonomuraea africana]|uniref:AraC-like DNA-binding protein n=1 Tax=Nonomuraea africana TaxID=46171 RepID=A0ABR9KWS5_9ACTN|nr:helix-turn-helix transcriptional regulator [Nonomuraea africana]MBE1566480.1 AraC-like DNA-binding protein [Nonomuraea africana]